MVAAKKTPSEIMDDHLTWQEKTSITKILSSYQKSQVDWDMFRKKLPEDLLNKFQNVLKEARENGYFLPKVVNNHIQWKQIFGFKRNYKNADKCTLCPCNFIAGDCKGGSKHKFGTILFRPCWE
jgi:hypothetical protein